MTEDNKLEPPTFPFDYSGFHREFVNQLSSLMCVPSWYFWRPHNRVGEWIEVEGRKAQITEVGPPQNHSEAERIVVRFEDNGEVSLRIIREIWCGGDRMR